MDTSSVTREAHHAAPRSLISLHEKANGTSLDGQGIQAWLEWEWEAMRWRVPVEISRVVDVVQQGQAEVCFWISRSFVLSSLWISPSLTRCKGG